MNCSGCGFEVQSGFAFCPKCGTKQPNACPGCGFPCAPDFVYCPKCGSLISGTTNDGGQASAQTSPATLPIRSSSPPLLQTAQHAFRPQSDNVDSEANRRTITVLFADLSGFTAMSERLDPEVMQTLQNQLFEELTAAVQSFGGFVDKFIGDALLALFGAPTAHEDDPERAVRAALDMISRTARLSERAKAYAGSPLQLHVGINTGHVVAGGLGVGVAKSYSVTGDTVNTAQRLQSMASPDEVLVGPLTHRLTRHAFSYDSLGEISLKGKMGSVLVHRLRGPLDTPRAARGLDTLGLDAPLIGRDAELARVIGSLDRACGGAAQLVRLVGEAGIGKTRLVNEFVARIRDEDRFAGVAIRRAVCSPLGEQSYGALAAVLRSAYGIAQKAGAAEAETKVAEALSELGLAAEEADRLMPLYLHVLGLGDPNAVLRHVEPEQLRRQIFFAIRSIFERRLALSPLLIIVEDLHWADAVSLEALRFLMDRLEWTRLMLLFTHRPALVDQFGSSRISHTTIRLPPLGDADGRRLLAAYFSHGWREPPGHLFTRILDRAGGNPLFLEEIIRGLIEGGALERDGAQWRMKSDEAAADIPASIQALLLARLDRLPHQVRQLAQEAAVIGPRFDAAVLGAAATEPARVEAGLELLCDAELIEEVAGSSSMSLRTYRFTQTMLQDVIYQNLLLQRRVELHGRIGAALERLCGNEPERLEDLIQLGHHFSLSASKPKGARYLRGAGDRARASYANDDAIRFYQQSLAVLSTASEREPERLILYERIADLSRAVGRRSTAEEHYQSALEGHRTAGDRIAEARILRKLGGLLWDAGKRIRAEERYAEAAERLGGTDAPIEWAHLLQERGRLAFRVGDHVAAARWADEALGYARSVPANADEQAGLEAARAIAEALNTKAVALARLGRNQEAVDEVEQSVAAAETAGLLNVACRGYTNLGVLYTIVDPAQAMAVCRRGLDVANRIGDLGFQARLLANLAVACCTFTDRCTEEGVPAAEKAIEIDRALDQREHLPVPLIVLGQIHQCHFRPDLAARCYNEAIEVASETGEPQQLFPCYDGLATLNLDRGDMPEAERYFALAHDVCARHGLDPAGLIVLPFLD
ncbi:adenylate/guanylate cyclase domain-containing protein [Bradyrhizobium zhanjiangense]|uniref:Adenylate/guanylate cyclase domain-containing protein n=1 Tax=Bradyrhizobium zhanjiangense TaxID=1325107 RepID=A0ABY0DPY1_9BRAD|nr:adenylate/guanylate cyclase domain-containing protein [Bradyrhizobium zhanjiangense]RXG97698.1 adenylate/guanylate cyclase domain-containing protein [Bradyrhizobium zhanjiangense]